MLLFRCTSGSCFRLSLAPIAALLFPILLLSAQENAKLPWLHGTVRDASGAPVANASLSLRKKDSSATATTTTGADGHYSFVRISIGKYSLHAAKKGYRDVDIASIVITTGEAATEDLVLEVDPIAAPQFFDQPQFTVSGVTDTTSLGGHGSDTVVRTRDSIAKDTTTLSKAEAEPSAPEIDESLRNGNYAQARDEVRSQIARKDTAALHDLLGSIDEKLADPLEAVHEYQRAVQMDPTEPYIFDWGSELLLHHASGPAAEVFDKGTKLFPKSTRMWIGLGAASFASGNNEEAVRQFCAASDLNPGDPTPYLFLGKMLHVEKNSSNEFLEKLHRFVTLQPENAQANYYYAVTLWKNRDAEDKAQADQVESLLARSIHLDPQFAEAELQLGIVLADQADYVGAIPHYERAVQIAPQTEEAHFRLAQAYRQAGHPDKGKAELRIYEQLSKESAKQRELERHEIQQFVYTLRDQPSSESSKP